MGLNSNLCLFFFKQCRIKYFRGIAEKEKKHCFQFSVSIITTCYVSLIYLACASRGTGRAFGIDRTALIKKFMQPLFGPWLESPASSTADRWRLFNLATSLYTLAILLFEKDSSLNIFKRLSSIMQNPQRRMFDTDLNY